MRAFLVAALALLPLLAGCSGDEDGPEEPLAATATTGILRGVVVDEAIRPLLRVNVTLPLPDGTVLNSTTAEDGAFAFGDLVPGGYVVQARKLGYLDTAVSVNVTAGDGDPDGVRVLMGADVLNAPFVEE